MKKKLIVSLGVFALMIGATSATLYAFAPRELFDFNAPTQSDRLPESSKRFIERNYPGSDVLNVDLEVTGYEVYLDNGVIIDFNFNETVDWIENSGTLNNSYQIDHAVNANDTVSSSTNMTESSIPSEDLSLAQRAFLANNYPDATILRIEYDEDGYDVYLSNGLTVAFDFDGDIEVEQEYNDDDEYDEEDMDDDIVIAQDEIPEMITAYVASNYPQASIILVEQDDDGYDVYLDNNVNIEFEFDGSIELESSETDRDDWNDWEDTIPVSELPESVLNYLSTNYPGLNILKVEFEDGIYEVYLSNRLELTFSANGTLLDIDVD